MIITYKISTDSILSAIKLETYVSGESTKDKEEMLSTKSQADSDNYDVLSIYLAEAEGRITDLLSGMLEEVAGSEIVEESALPSVLVYVFNAPKDFDRNQDKGIIQGIKDFMVYYVLEMWFRTTWPDKARLYSDLIDESVFRLNHRLNKRICPVRRMVPPLGF